jgi:hypothetical protein
VAEWYCAYAVRFGVSFRPYGLVCLAAAMALEGEHGASLAAAREGLKVQAMISESW